MSEWLHELKINTTNMYDHENSKTNANFMTHIVILQNKTSEVKKKKCAQFAHCKSAAQIDRILLFWKPFKNSPENYAMWE